MEDILKTFRQTYYLNVNETREQIFLYSFVFGISNSHPLRGLLFLTMYLTATSRQVFIASTNKRTTSTQEYHYS